MDPMELMARLAARTLGYGPRMRNTIAGLVLLLTGCSTSSGPSETVSTPPAVNIEALCGCDWASEYCMVIEGPEGTAVDPCAATSCKTCACLNSAPDGCHEYDGGKLIVIGLQ